MSAPALSLLTFLAVTLGVTGIYSILTDLFFRDRTRVGNRVDDEFRREQRAHAEQSSLFRNLHQLAANSRHEDEEQRTAAQRFASMVEQSGLNIRPGSVLALSLVTGLAAGLLVGVLMRSVPFGAGAFLAAGVMPILHVRRKKRARMEKLLSQLSEAFDLMGRVIRAGQTMSQALLAVADEFAPPIAAEFSYCYEQQNLGMPPEATYRDLARRNDLVEIKLFVLALLVQQQTGGNLAELLDRLSLMLRDRYRIRGLIQTLTAESRMQAFILLGMPPIFFVIMFVMSRDYALVLLEHPNLLGLTLFAEFLGALWIRKIVNFDF